MPLTFCVLTIFSSFFADDFPFPVWLKLKHKSRDNVTSFPFLPTPVQLSVLYPMSIVDIKSCRFIGCRFSSLSVPLKRFLERPWMRPKLPSHPNFCTVWPCILLYICCSVKRWKCPQLFPYLLQTVIKTYIKRTENKKLKENTRWEIKMSDLIS